MNGAFSVGTDPGPALLTDGQQMAFCVQRGSEREKEGTERGREKKRHIEKMGGSEMGFFRTLQTGALYAGLKRLIT